MIIPLEEYATSNTKIRCRCISCGNEWHVTPNKLLIGRGCPECAQKKKASKLRKTTKEFVEELREIDGNILICSDYYNAWNR